MFSILRSKTGNSESDITNTKIPFGSKSCQSTNSSLPAQTKSRFSLSLRKCLKKGVLKRKVMERPWEIPAARTAPEWIIGPSCKRKRPDHDPPDPTLGRSPDRKRTRQQRNRQALHELDKRTKNSRILRSPAQRF